MRKARLLSRAAGGHPARSQGHTRVARGWRLPGAAEGEGGAGLGVLCPHAPGGPARVTAG